MPILALEASGETASCALWDRDRIIERVCEPGAASSSTLLPAVAALLAETGAVLADLDAVAFGAGPGSFTGLRVACGLAQGLAFGLGIPVVAVGTLAAMAGPAGDGKVMAVLDARMGEVYFACFEVANAYPTALGEPGVLAPAAVPVPPELPTWRVCGNAIAAYPELRERLAAAGALDSACRPMAAAVARIAARQFATVGGIAARDAAPIYVRDRVALTTAERLAAGGKA